MIHTDPSRFHSHRSHKNSSPFYTVTSQYGSVTSVMRMVSSRICSRGNSSDRNLADCCTYSNSLRLRCVILIKSIILLKFSLIISIIINYYHLSSSSTNPCMHADWSPCSYDKTDTIGRFLLYNTVGLRHNVLP